MIQPIKQFKYRRKGTLTILIKIEWHLTFMSDFSQIPILGDSSKYKIMAMCISSGVRQPWDQGLTPLLLATCRWIVFQREKHEPNSARKKTVREWKIRQNRAAKGLCSGCCDISPRPPNPTLPPGQKNSFSWLPTPQGLSSVEEPPYLGSHTFLSHSLLQMSHPSVGIKAQPPSCPNSCQLCKALLDSVPPWEWLKPVLWLHNYPASPFANPTSITLLQVLTPGLPSKLPVGQILSRSLFPCEHNPQQDHIQNT